MSTISKSFHRMIRSPGNRQFGGFDIMSLFKGGANPTPAPAPTNNPSGAANPGQPLPGVDPNNPTVPSGTPAPTPANPPAQTPAPAPASPFDGLQDIWQTPANPTPEEPIIPNVDPAKLMEAAGKVDFTKSITPEILQKIQAGGEGASQAFLTAMNSVAQTAFAHSAMATTKIVEQSLGRQAEKFNKDLPSQIRKLSANESLLAENPLLSNPAVQPLVVALQEQLVRKNPQATAGEIQTQINNYFGALGKAFNPDKPAASQSGKKEEDWSAFFQ